MSHLRNIRIMDGTSTDLAQVSTTGDVHIVLRNLGSSISSNSGTQVNVTNFNSTGGQIFNNSTNSGFVQISDGSTRVCTVVENKSGVLALNIHDADFHETIINSRFHQHTGTINNLATSANAGDISLVLTSTTGFSVGNYLDVMEGLNSEADFPKIITNSTATATLTLNKPIDNDYTTGGSAEWIKINLATSGSSTSPNKFHIKPPSDEIWHVTRILIAMTCATQPDDSEFGDITALTNGVVMRENKNSTSEFRTLTTWNANADMVADMYDVEYAERSVPAGSWGVRGRWTFKRSDAMVKLDGSLNDKLEILIQDSTTEISSFTVKSQGHVEGQ